jgi:hypothetical protein
MTDIILQQYSKITIRSYLRHESQTDLDNKRYNNSIIGSIQGCSIKNILCDVFPNDISELF